MASTSIFPGFSTRFCETRTTLSIFCDLRTIIDTVNLIFAFLFLMLMLLSTISKQHRIRSRIIILSPFLFASIACALVGTAYFGFGAIKITTRGTEKEGRISHSDWLPLLAYITRGFIWSCLAVSSFIQGSKWAVILSSFWSIIFFLLISGLNINSLVKKQETTGSSIIDTLLWPLNLLLLLCAFKDWKYLARDKPPADNLLLSEPLIVSGQSSGQTREEKPVSFFSRLIFSWINPLLRLGYSKPLVLTDIPPLYSEDEAGIAYQRYFDAWEDIHKKKSTNTSIDNGNSKVGNLVMKALVRVYLKDMVFIGVGALVKILTTVATPLLLYAFIEYTESKEEEDRSIKKKGNGMLLLGLLILVKCAESLSQRHWFFQARRIGMRMRSGLMVAVYQKQLRLSSLGKKRHSTGEIVNYIGVDAYRMGEFQWWFHYFWSMVLLLFLGIGVLFFIMGSGALFGLLPLFICIFLDTPYTKLLQKHQTRLMKAQDERLRATSEALNNIKVIKLQTWEEKFKSLVESLRSKEFQDLSAQQYIRASGTAIYWLCPTIISSTIFLGCALLGSAPLDARTIFTVLVTLRSMSEPMRMIPESLSVLTQVMVSFNRLNAFLLEDDHKNEDISIIKGLPEEDEEVKYPVTISIDKGNFSWDPVSTTKITLRDINLQVEKRMKVAICGPVGAGKSSLLYAMLKEIPKLSGTVGVLGSIAYVAQTSWIQSGTVRENILYGKPMDQKRYQQAIRVTALDKDIGGFSHGDLTEIGQRGLNMSGGQKQRIQLARAVYNDAEIYLLDDPFSAVDALTAANLFHNCVIGALEKKTVILVTHQVEFLSTVDKILVMEEGKIIQCGTYEELLVAGTAFKQLINAHNNAITITELAGCPDTERNKVQEDSTTDETEFLEDSKIENCSEKDSTAYSQLVEEEEKEVGDGLWKPLFDYVNISRGMVSLGSSVISQTGFVIFQAMATYWLAVAIQTPDIGSSLIISVYAGISACSTIFVFFRAFFAARLSLQASKAFFEGFTNSIFKAPMLFFDSTPVGRIFTRASSDLSILDNDISFSITLVMAPALELIAIIAIMASVTWQVVIVVIIVMVASTYVLRYYFATAREIVRMNGTTKAPVMNYAAETSLGVTTIRAFNMTDRFLRRYLQLVDTDAKLFLCSNVSTEWLVLRIEVLQNLTLFTATFLLLLLPKGSVAPGLVGLSLTYALTFTGTQVFMSRWFCSLSNYIISVERIKQFMHIQPEPPRIIEEHRPPTTWPCKGTITLQELMVRYRPNAPLVLKGITCSLEGGTRVGVVGRTGSGKTTLISALFRLVEPESGRILIDGTDICSIGLQDLRTKLSIIPQEPTLFSGSVRSNLDPLGLYSDKEIWEALEKCQLKATISSLPGELDSLVTDEGENWSAGQRQLFCLGRVLLKRNKILVLDEATASIDSATDVILQKIIREEFPNCTVITVAHRVPTVIDSSMVMVLSFGRLEEYEEPTKLMQRNSSFAKLVKEYYTSCRGKSFNNKL